VADAVEVVIRPRPRSPVSLVSNEDTSASSSSLPPTAERDTFLHTLKAAVNDTRKRARTSDSRRSGETVPKVPAVVSSPPPRITDFFVKK
jgi:hypothetical protein